MKLNSFGDWPEKYKKLERSKIVLIPAPYDRTSTWIKGADKGPRAIIEASINLENYDIETGDEVFKRGIFTANPLRLPEKPDAMTAEIKKNVKKYLDRDKLVVVLGGEHSVSIGAAAAYKDKYANLSILQLDAHADLREDYQGSKFNHACVMARAKEACPIVQAGIRSMDISEKRLAKNSRIFFAHEIFDNSRWHEKAISKLTDKVYITIDLDVFDPGIMPSTGTPEPGGLLWYPVISFLKKVCEEKDVVGFDVAELCPNKESKAPDFLAAKLIYKLLGYIFKTN